MSCSITAVNAPRSFDCPVCGGPSAPFPTLRPRTAFFCCRACDLRFQQPAAQEDGSIYAEVELPREQQAREGVRPEDRAASAAYYRRLDHDVLETLARAAPGRRLLDVGSGTGRFLASAVGAGFSCAGVDISPALAEAARNHSGAPVYVGSVPDLNLPAASFDIVNLDYVLAYVPEPPALMREIARLLAPGGICRVREFIADSLNGRLQRGNWWPYDDTTLRVYSRRSVRTLAGAAGLRLERCLAGAELSYGAWRAWALRKKVHPLKRGPAGYWLKKGSLLGIPLAGDCAFYLRKPGFTGHVSAGPSSPAA